MLATFAPANIQTLNGSSVANTSTYYYDDDDVKTTTEPVYDVDCDPFTGECFYTLIRYDTVTTHTWKTVTINELPALKFSMIDIVQWN